MRGFLSIMVALFLAALPASAGAEQFKLTLDQAVSRALEENRDIQVAKERLAEIEGIKGEALAQGLPQLTGIGQYQRTWRKTEISINDQTFRVGKNNQYVAGAQVTQLLFDGGRVIRAVRAARTEKARGLENVRDVEQQIKFQVRQTFYEILYTDRAIEVLDRQLKQLRAHLGSMKERFSQGLESDYAVMRQDVEVANLEPQIIDARRSRELSVNALKVLLVIPPGDGLAIEGAFDYRVHDLAGVDALVSQSVSNRPDLAAERLRVKSLEQGVSVEKSGYWPTLNFDTTWQWQGQTDDWRAGPNERVDALTSAFNLSWPIFDGLKTHSRVKQAKAKLYQQRAMASKLEDEVIKGVKDSYESLIKSRQALAGQQKSLSTARRASEIAGLRFEAGLMSQIELIDTINAQARAEQLYLRAAFDCLVGEAAIELAVGGEM